MLRSLRLERYRGFESYELSDFKRINLLVGPNNSGKTSILEAIDFLVAQGDPGVLVRTAIRRGEVNYARYGKNRVELSNISHFFHGHKLWYGATFRLSGGRYGPIVAQVQPTDADRMDSLFHEEASLAALFNVKIEGNASEKPFVIPVTEAGEVEDRAILAMHRSRRRLSPKSPPVQFIAPESVGLGETRAMWDTVQAEGREHEVVTALRVLVSDLKSIHFLTADWSRFSSSSAGILLGIGAGNSRIPLGSCGDGLRRLLALSLSLLNVKDGFMLVDEIDAGLHWTVMKDMWRLVLDTAQRSNIQVFATTHSADCIRGLARLAGSDSVLSEDVAIYKIERLLEEAVRFSGEDLQVATDQEIEVR